ncbi:hypothetical protein E4U49_005155 [Claviceps purpurea]|nr:hypothetical protein E4U49_005155 [Claviceps purpurea]
MTQVLICDDLCQLYHKAIDWVNNPTLTEFCFGGMIGRADIEGSKSEVHIFNRALQPLLMSKPTPTSRLRNFMSQPHIPHPPMGWSRWT